MSERMKGKMYEGKEGEMKRKNERGRKGGGREGERERERKKKKKDNKTCSKITGHKGKVGRTNVQFCEEIALYKNVPSWPKPLLYASYPPESPP